VRTLLEHPVVVASAIAGLLLGLVPLALPIESSSDALRAAGIALLVVGLPPLLTSRFIEATTRAAVVTLAGTMLLRTSIFGALDPLTAMAIGAGFTCILVVGGSVATRISNAEEEQ
jgi:membrane protein DedA with SNARE-associated domain